MLPFGESVLSCEVPIELGKLGIVPECGGGNGGKHNKYFEMGSFFLCMKLLCTIHTM